MTKFLLIIALILLVLFLISLLGLYIQKQIYKLKLEEQKEESKQQMNEINSQAQGIINNVKQKKDNLHTGNNTNNFNNSLNILQNIAEHGC